MTSVAEGMKIWSANVKMRGPGSALEIKRVEDAAIALADGMEAGRILIPTDEAAMETLARFGADPDGFVRGKIEEAVRGDFGLPTRLPPGVD
jgi:hypothetical protein